MHRIMSVYGLFFRRNSMFSFQFGCLFTIVFPTAGVIVHGINRRKKYDGPGEAHGNAVYLKLIGQIPFCVHKQQNETYSINSTRFWFLANYKNQFSLLWNPINWSCIFRWKNSRNRESCPLESRPLFQWRNSFDRRLFSFTFWAILHQPATFLWFHFISDDP